MSTARTPISWAAVPRAQVVRLTGITPDQLAVALDPLPADAPVVVRYRMPPAAPSAAVIVDDALDRLEVVARDLFPGWLRDADLVDTTSDLDRRVVRQLARRRTSAAEHFGPFLADVAEAALLGRPVRNRFPPETRALGLARILSEAYHRGGVALLIDPTSVLTPSPGYRARVSVISMIGLTNEQQREGFVNQLQMAMFAWIKRNPAGERPLGGLLVMDEAQNFAPSTKVTACLRSTLALSSQARKYGLGLVFATQSPTGLHNHIPGNAATQFYGLLNASTQIAIAKEIARVKGGQVPDISKLRAGNFYVALEGNAFHKIQAPWCLSHHSQSPPTADEVLALARQSPPGELTPA